MVSLDSYPLLKDFVGLFYPLHIVATWYWVFAVIFLAYLMQSRAMSVRFAKLLADGAMWLGGVLLFICGVYAVIAYTDEIGAANRLGGISENERKALYIHFRCLVAWRASITAFFVGVALFLRFSLLPYVMQSRAKSAHPPQAPTG